MRDHFTAQAAFCRKLAAQWEALAREYPDAEFEADALFDDPLFDDLPDDVFLLRH
jgi:hypothetical protein